MTPLAQGSWLIVGCGYLGTRVLARLAAARATTAVVTRDATRAASFASGFGARTFAGDYADAHGLRAFCATLPSPLRVLCLLPPAACTDAHGGLARFAGFCAMLTALAPARALLTSSTGVYGARAGASVSAETPCRPETPRERRLHDIETLWLAGTRRHVLRCAGLYGPGRIIGLAGLRARAPVAGAPDGWLNLLHVEDAAALLLRMATQATQAVELGADGRPITRRVYYAMLAAAAGVPGPVFDGTAALRGGGARRCDSATTRARLAWQPMYTDFRAGLAGLELR